jgi:hypothetical protein
MDPPIAAQEETEMKHLAMDTDRDGIQKGKQILETSFFVLKTVRGYEEIKLGSASKLISFDSCEYLH